MRFKFFYSITFITISALCWPANAGDRKSFPASACVPGDLSENATLRAGADYIVTTNNFSEGATTVFCPVIRDSYSKDELDLTILYSGTINCMLVTYTKSGEKVATRYMAASSAVGARATLTTSDMDLGDGYISLKCNLVGRDNHDERGKMYRYWYDEK